MRTLLYSYYPSTGNPPSRLTAGNGQLRRERKACGNGIAPSGLSLLYTEPFSITRPFVRFNFDHTIASLCMRDKERVEHERGTESTLVRERLTPASIEKSVEHSRADSSTG